MTGAVEPDRRSANPFFDRLRSPLWLARHAMVGLVLFALGVLIFGLFAYNVGTNGPLLRADPVVANDLHAVALRSAPALIGAMIFGSFLGRELVVLIGLGLALFFLYKRFWRELAMVAVGFGGEEALFETLSRLFNRHRPVFAQPITTVLTVPGFPSGHTMSAVVCYGLLAYLIAPRMPTRFWKEFVVALALFIMVYIGFSRVFLGDHFLTDVLAGYALGLGWAAMSYLVVEKLFHH